MFWWRGGPNNAACQDAEVAGIAHHHAIAETASLVTRTFDFALGSELRLELRNTLAYRPCDWKWN